MSFGTPGVLALRLVLCGASHRSGGPVASGILAFLGRSRLRIRRRRLGGKAVGGNGASRLVSGQPGG